MKEAGYPCLTTSGIRASKVLSIHILLVIWLGLGVGEMEEDDVQPCKALQITKKMTDDT